MVPTALRCWKALPAATLIVLAACSSGPDHPPTGQLSTLPTQAVGTVLVGPRGLESVSDKDQLTMFAFDKDGTVLGQVDGRAISGARVLAENDRVVTASAESLTLLTDSARTSYPSIKNSFTIKAAASSPQGSSATVWYDTGVIDNTYTASYVSLTSKGRREGRVPGIAGTTGYCADRNVAIVRESFVSNPSENPTRNWLYEMGTDQKPVVKGQWNYDPEFRPVTSTSPCSPDGTTLYTLYASEATVTSSTGAPGLTLVRIDTSNGERSETQLTMPGHTWSTQRDSLALHDNKLYWTTHDGDVLSVPADGSSTTVTQEWTLPTEDSIVDANEDGTLSVLTTSDTPTFSRHSLSSGAPEGEPIPLSWLSDIHGHPTEGGGTIYTITDIAGLPR
jgi:hypothetical protein